MANAERRGLALDTSVVVPALLRWHEHHRPALRLFKLALDEGPPLLPARVLVESYSVLTRLPAPHRLAPGVACELLSANLRQRAQTIDFPAAERWDFLHAAAGDETSGGAVYDAEIVHAAVAAGARGIVTLNRSDFERLAPPDFAVVSDLVAP